MKMHLTEARFFLTEIKHSAIRIHPRWNRIGRFDMQTMQERTEIQIYPQFIEA